MRQQTILLIATLLLSAVVLQAQQPGEAPFATLEKAVNEERWTGNKEHLSKVFDDERRRLGAQFESELLKWLGNNPARITGFRHLSKAKVIFTATRVCRNWHC